jgi:phosphate starvation-inducible protein PhoH
LRKNSKGSKKRSKVIDLTQDINLNRGYAYRNRLKPRTENQKEYIRTVAENTITFCQGLAGNPYPQCRQTLRTTSEQQRHQLAT